MATVPMAISVSSDTTVFIEDKGSVYRITLQQLKTALDAMT